MGVIHFLNVKEGDCIWVEHMSNNNTIIDISNASTNQEESLLEFTSLNERNGSGNFNRKNYPTNPIEYFNNHGMVSIFRFILTHPDMDHMDGIKALFEEYDIYNFWDTLNTKTMDENKDWGRYNKEDWKFYQSIRKNSKMPKVLNLYAGTKGYCYNQDENGNSGADGLYILAPTKELVEEANSSEEYNDCSYVILYKTNDKKIVFAGDSAEKTWDYILENHKDQVENVDILIAPHHGRKTGGNDEYLDILNPKLTLFGNAKSEHLDYSSWNNRKLDHITNNQADNIILDTNGSDLDVYVTYENFAKTRDENAVYSEKYDAWKILSL
ncbi:hypothetical protein CCS79_13555 [Clostridium diolis]|uniref:ComEC/Rec2 family competence protein n=1 Tax=Clostridium diolis TaxID=223919 RepID=UPI000B3F8785|nr:hypothetical protein [Clostridium diolis]OVE67976.1 hypothetical protein CCS79_13555 [Clostridium diolis]